RLTAKGRAPLEILGTQTQGVLECYEAVCRAALQIDWPAEQDELLASAQAAFDHARLLGLATHDESANETTFGNAIEWLRVAQILEWAPEAEDAPKGGRPRKQYAPGEQFEGLRAVHRRLAAATSGG
ncbi:hypothetical protein MK280_19865, partial [Myxococcota bacterium]|nr:hypothetical protein [Myxococcota bacterium]